MTERGDRPRNGSDDRQRRAAAWAGQVLGIDAVTLQPVSGDASFRRYFRVTVPTGSVILMDAPPEREDSRPFVDVAARLHAAGLKAPRILDFDLELGFGLLEDFGDVLYRDLLDTRSAPDLMPGLFDVLETLATRVSSEGLPTYDERVLQSELDLFPEWYLESHRRRPLAGGERDVWADVCDALIASATRQPQVFVHKDFHSCNLLQTDDGPGLIDFQDALRGPVSYDLVSMLWDRYIAWPRKQLEAWLLVMRARLAADVGADAWIRWCDLMSLQRNLKIVGIFARLRHRDGKDGYVEMIPRFYRYLLDVLPRYPEFRAFQRLLEEPECGP